MTHIHASAWARAGRLEAAVYRFGLDDGWKNAPKRVVVRDYEWPSILYPFSLQDWNAIILMLKARVTPVTFVGTTDGKHVVMQHDFGGHVKMTRDEWDEFRQAACRGLLDVEKLEEKSQ